LSEKTAIITNDLDWILVCHRHSTTRTKLGKYSKNNIFRN